MAVKTNDKQLVVNPKEIAITMEEIRKIGKATN